MSAVLDRAQAGERKQARSGARLGGCHCQQVTGHAIRTGQPGDEQVAPRTRSPSSTRPAAACPRAMNNLAIQAFIAAYTDRKAIQASACAAVTEITTD
jgi:hypothetical protein